MARRDILELSRRISALESAKAASVPPQPAVFPLQWMTDNQEIMQAIANELANRAIAHRGFAVSLEWYRGNRDWERWLPCADVVVWLLRDRQIKSPDGRRLMPDYAAADALGRMIYSMVEWDSVEHPLDIIWQHTNYLPPIDGSQELMAKLWPGVTPPEWQPSWLHPSAVPFPDECMQTNVVES